MLVGAGADEVERRAVLRGARLHELADVHLVQRVGNAGERFDAQLFRNFVEQVFDALRADGGEHLADVLRACAGLNGMYQPSAARCASYSAAASSAAGAPVGLEPHDPARAVRLGVDQLGLAAERRIAFDDGARDRRVHVGGGLHRFDHGERVAGLERLAGFRHFDEHQVAERALRVVGDADFDVAVGERANPFVRLGVFQIGGDVGSCDCSAEDETN